MFRRARWIAGLLFGVIVSLLMVVAGAAPGAEAAPVQCSDLIPRVETYNAGVTQHNANPPSSSNTAAVEAYNTEADRFDQERAAIQSAAAGCKTGDVNAALKGYKTQYYKFGNTSFKLDRDDLKHILTRHHPKYWDGSVKKEQTFLDRNMSVDDVTRAIGAVLQQNRDAVVAAGIKFDQYFGTYQGVRYQVGVGNGLVGQFFPKPA
ncbi:hypothetical protein ACWCW7_09245 [Nocardia tengchongensis]